MLITAFCMKLIFVHSVNCGIDEIKIQKEKGKKCREITYKKNKYQSQIS